MKILRRLSSFPQLLAEVIACTTLGLSGCGSGSATGPLPEEDAALAMRSGIVQNPAAYIPSQCYTKTKDLQGSVHNPCYACHQASIAPNAVDDADLQLEYAFATPARTNRWSNLFQDRSKELAAIDDTMILEYVRQDNYLDKAGFIQLQSQLAHLPPAWDADHNGRWDGFIPDLFYRLDQDGFDRDLKGNYTGWRAYAYYPFLGTFWPTNGAMDDVLIRLDPVMQRDRAGHFDITTYKVNLAIVQALVQRRDVEIEPVDEQALGVDLDKNGVLGTARKIKFDWAPREGRDMRYVGQAQTMQEAGKIHLAAGLFPEGTEFLHSVRYLDVTEKGEVSMAPRMKELRYAVKRTWYSYGQLQSQAVQEAKEKDQFPDRLRQITGNAEVGLSNGQGWIYQGFIEDKAGNLRPQTYEENMYCMGCHGGIGATTDSNFSFPRKLADGTPNNAWLHTAQMRFKGMPEPVRADGEGEYSHYLQHNGAGDELRENQEILLKFFDAQGQLKPQALSELQSDISKLIIPSPNRALALNKRYKIIVDEQRFIWGRDATLRPAENVHQIVEEGQLSGIEQPLAGPH